MGNIVNNMITYPFICKIDNSKFRVPKMYLVHMKWHNEPHRPYTSYSYFCYNTLKQLGLIDKYMTWDYWNCYGFFKWSDDISLYKMWRESLQDTCYNLPCYECYQKNIQRTSVDRARTLGKGEGKTNYIPRSFTVTRSGLKVYNIG